MNLFKSSGNFYRGNIHTHSNRSDGALPPEEVCRIYREAGYDFLCLSDHFLEEYSYPLTDTVPYRRDGFTTIIGAEIHAPKNSHGEIWHLLACGLPDDFQPPSKAEDAVSLARRAVEAGAFLGIAHPQWSGLRIEDGRQMASIAHAVEIWNVTATVECDRGDGLSFLDSLLNEGHRLFGYAADDAHFNARDWFGASMMVKAPTNEPDALVAAMKRGDFYSSRGPSIQDVSLSGHTLHAEFSPASAVMVLGRGSRVEFKVFSGELGTTVNLPLDRFAGDWCRLVVVDEQGKQAWTNPVWLD